MFPLNDNMDSIICRYFIDKLKTIMHLLLL